MLVKPLANRWQFEVMAASSPKPTNLFDAHWRASNGYSPCGSNTAGDHSEDRRILSLPNLEKFKASLAIVRADSS